MSGWGETAATLYASATHAAREAGQAMMASTAAAVRAVRAAAAAVAHGTRNVGDFGARVVAETTVAAGRILSAGTDRVLDANPVTRLPYRAAKARFSSGRTPRARVVEACPNSWAAKKVRLEERAALIRAGRGSGVPATQEAAERLARNNEAVELARLSQDAYAQSPPRPGHEPPPGWLPMGEQDLAAAGIDPALLEDSRAVIYRSEADWPGGQKTVLAFRGTADLDDAVVDHDQALGIETRQYKASVRLGTKVFQNLGQDVMVTGHSLGGGKAQAAGVAGGFAGAMFNSAGLNSASVGRARPDPDRFMQYRTPADPLTGVQNSAALQTAVAAIAGVFALPLGGGMKAGDALQKGLGAAGLSPEAADYADKAFKALPRGIRNLVQDGNILPPALGRVWEVPAIGPDGTAVPPWDPLGQHGIGSVINGIEQQKAEDLATLKETGR